MPLIGRLLEPAYRAVVRARNRAFDQGNGVTRFDVPVISVGNLSVGGTGKTPTVRLIVERLRTRCVTPAIAMRGYKANPGTMGDEEAEYREALGEIAIIAQPDRVAGIGALLHSRDDIGAIVLDDGFQHRAVARDLDLVLLDATRSPFTDRCLPAGWLREPVSSLGRAGFALVTRAGVGDVDGLERDLQCSFPALPLARAEHAWSTLLPGDGSEHPIEWLRDRHAIVACAIGHPSAFVEQCERAGCAVEDVVVKPDHHAWTPGEVHRLEHEAIAFDGVVLTTGKDWVKMREHARTPLRFVRPALEIRLDDAGSAALDRALDAVLG